MILDACGSAAFAQVAPAMGGMPGMGGSAPQQEKRDVLFLFPYSPLLMSDAGDDVQCLKFIRVQWRVEICIFCLASGCSAA